MAKRQRRKRAAERATAVADGGEPVLADPHPSTGVSDRLLAGRRIRPIVNMLHRRVRDRVAVRLRDEENIPWPEARAMAEEIAGEEIDKAAQEKGVPFGIGGGQMLEWIMANMDTFKAIVDMILKLVKSLNDLT